MGASAIVYYICIIYLLCIMSFDLISFFNAWIKAKKSGRVFYVQDVRKGWSIFAGVVWLLCSAINFSGYSTFNRELALLQLLLGIANIEQSITYGAFVTKKGLYYHKSLYGRGFTGNFSAKAIDSEIWFFIERANKKKNKQLFRFDNTRKNEIIFRYFLKGDESASIYFTRIKKRYIVISGAVILAATAALFYMRYAPPEILPPMPYTPYSEYERFDTKTVYSIGDIPSDCKSLLITSEEKELSINDEDVLYSDYINSILTSWGNIKNDNTDDSFYEYKLICDKFDAEKLTDSIAGMDLKRLGFHCVELKNINKFSYMENLEYLYIYGVYYDDYHKQMPLDLDFKGDFPALKELTITNCDFKKIGNIKNISTLERLNIPDNKIRSLSGLEKLTNLSRLNISWNSDYSEYVRSLAPIRGLTGLTALSVSRCIGNNEQFANLKYLENLEILDINTTNRGNTSLDFLENCSGLRMLNAQNCNIKDVSPLKNLTDLEYLELQMNLIEDISAFKDMTGLTYLSVYNNYIADMSVLSGIRNAETLYIGNNPTEDISFVEWLKNLKFLNMRIMPVSDISPIAEIKGIEHLDISNTHIEDISPLSECSSLRVLSIKSTGVSDISVVSKLPLLEVLDIERTKVNDISDLSECTALKRVYLSGLELSDYSPLFDLTDLEVIDIGNRDSFHSVSELKEWIIKNTLMYY